MNVLSLGNFSKIGFATTEQAKYDTKGATTTNLFTDTSASCTKTGDKYSFGASSSSSIIPGAFYHKKPTVNDADVKSYIEQYKNMSSEELAAELKKVSLTFQENMDHKTVTREFFEGFFVPMTMEVPCNETGITAEKQQVAILAVLKERSDKQRLPEDTKKNIEKEASQMSTDKLKSMIDYLEREILKGCSYKSAAKGHGASICYPITSTACGFWDQYDILCAELQKRDPNATFGRLPSRKMLDYLHGLNA